MIRFPVMLMMDKGLSLIAKPIERIDRRNGNRRRLFPSSLAREIPPPWK
jgi:hypothetical protein